MTILALIGRGKWGQNYIKTISQSNDWILSPENIKTTDYADLFSKKIDGIIIATPTPTHFQIASDFLKKGFNILIEKPITKTYQEAIRLQKIALQHPKQIVMAGHLQLYNPGYSLLKSLLPKIGSIQTLEYYGLQSPTRTDTTLLEDWAPHPTYLFNDMLGQEPLSVKAEKEKQKQVKLTYYYKNNIIGIAHIAWLSNTKERQIIVHGSIATLIFDDLNKTISLIKDNRLSVFQVNLQFSPLIMELKEFVSAIEKKRQPKSNITQAVSVMKILQQFARSLTNTGNL